MGNIGSSGSNGRRRSRRSNPPAPPPQEITPNRYVFAAATPYPNPIPSPNHNHNPNLNLNQHQQRQTPSYYQYPGYYPPPPEMPMSLPYDHRRERYTCTAVQSPAPYVEHQKAVTIRNDVNLKKETLRLVADEGCDGRFLVSFTFDATVSGSITLVFFAREGEDCELTPTKGDVLPPVTVDFPQGLGQKFRQPSGTGIDFSMFQEMELLRKEGGMDVYPIAVKAEASPVTQNESDGNSGSGTGSMNSQITQAVFEKDKGEYQVRVVKQILFVNGMRYELQEIYGIGNSVESDDYDGNDPGKECVICLSEPRDTTVLPCRHMCMCSGCAKVLRFQTNRCPICRQPVERLLEIKVSNGGNN